MKWNQGRHQYRFIYALFAFYLKRYYWHLDQLWFYNMRVELSFRTKKTTAARSQSWKTATFFKRLSIANTCERINFKLQLPTFYTHTHERTERDSKKKKLAKTIFTSTKRMATKLAVSITVLAKAYSLWVEKANTFFRAYDMIDYRVFMHDFPPL